MRVMLIYPAADYSTKDVATGIEAGLREAGHEVSVYRLSNRLDIALRGLTREKDGEKLSPNGVDVALLASEGIPFQAAMHGVDWVLGVHGVGLHPAALVALRRIGVKVAWWFTEAPYESNDDRELHFATHVDVAFVNERTSVGAFQAVIDRHHPGGSAQYLRHAYNPAVHYPGANATGEPLTDEERCDVLFVGTGFAERQHMFECCDWSGIDLHLGGLWLGIQPNYRLFGHIKHPPMQNPDLVRLYGGAKMVVNVHRDGDGAESANPRVWEAAACGVFQISDHRQEIVDVLGDAVPTYLPGVPHRFITTIRRYLADEPERKRLAALALERVQGETFTERARTIADALSEFDRSRAKAPALSAA